jgi:signal transduction histidine kinase
MLDQNLQNVEQHGVNTTRTLKAMEEMLKDRSGGIVKMNLVPVLRQDQEMVNNYFGENIKQYGIKTSFNIPQETIDIKGNTEQLSMTIMSLLGNAVYAVVKKAQREKYAPEITLSVTNNDTQYSIVIRDNGIGIEDTIIDKVFDPFFTTKPTGEAAGVGLYLSREIIQNIGGDISVKSEKNVYTEFTITLPILQN